VRVEFLRNGAWFLPNGGEILTPKSMSWRTSFQTPGTARAKGRTFT
jgi:hypothetical protein